MAKKAELKAVLTLDNLQFARSIKNSINLAKDLAKSFARSPIQSSFVAGMMGARKGLQLAGGAATAFASAMKVGLQIAGTAAVAIGGAIAIAGKFAIDAAAQYQDFNTTFEVLLGNADKAKARMKDLAQLADSTPFTLDQVAKASTMLEVLTNGTLSAGKGLRMIGDIASGTNTDFSEVAQNVGRLFSEIRSGLPMGRALLHLTEIGAISGPARGQIEQLAAVGKTAQAWQLAQQEFQRYAGMTEKRAKTWNGMISTFHDKLSAGLRAMGDPLIKGLTEGLIFVTKFLVNAIPLFAAVGKKMGEGIKAGTELIVGIFTDPAALVSPFISLLKAGFLEVGNIFLATMKTAVEIIGSEGFFSNLAQGFEGLALTVGGYFMKAFENVSAFLGAMVDAMLDKLPKSLGGNAASAEDKAALKEKSIADRKLAYAAYQEALSYPVGSRGREEFAATAKSAMARSNAELGGAIGATPTMQERIQKNLTENGKNSDAAIAMGSAKMKSAADSLSENIIAAAKNFEVIDVLGASDEYSKAAKGLLELMQKGKEKIAEATKEDGKSFSQTFMGGREIAGVADLHTARRTTSIFSLGERRSMENKRMHDLMVKGSPAERRGTSDFARHAVRSGDRARARSAQKEAMRLANDQKTSLEVEKEIRDKFDIIIKSLVTE